MSEPGITMVAFHGVSKPPEVTQFLDSVDRQLKQVVKRYFRAEFVPYDLPQIHATLIGMEAALVEGELCGRWFLENRKQRQPIRVGRLLDVVKGIAERSSPPTGITKQSTLFTVRFGGFPEAYCMCSGIHLDVWDCISPNAEFHSFDRTAYEQ